MVDSKYRLPSNTIHQPKCLTVVTFVGLCVCLSVTHLTHLSFKQYWNAVENSYFMRMLLLALANGEVIS